MSGSKYLTSKFANNEITKLGIETTAKGINNKLNGNDFFDGAAVGVLSTGLTMAHARIVNNKINYESAGPTVKKGLNGLVEGSINIDREEKKFLGINWNKEALLNKIPGFNVAAGVYEVLKMNGNIKDILNVPGMPIAATMTYEIIMQIQSPMSDN